MILSSYFWLYICSYFGHLVCQTSFSCFCQRWSQHSGISDHLWMNINPRYVHGTLCWWKFSGDIWKSWAFKFWADLFWLYLLIIMIICRDWLQGALHQVSFERTVILTGKSTFNHLYFFPDKKVWRVTYLFYLGSSQNKFCLSTFLVAF